MSDLGRREFSRVRVDVEGYMIRDDHPPTPLRALDIGEGGIRLQRVPLPALSRLKVHLFVPCERDDRQPRFLRLDGRVAWRTLASSGIRFTSISRRDRMTLRALVERRSASVRELVLVAS